MRKVLLVALDILREAAARKWIIGMLLAISLAGLVFAFTLEFQVVEGVLAGTRLFGHALEHDVTAPDLVLKPVFSVGAWVLFVGGVSFGILACSDFAPELLTPGRIEQLLSLPIRRWELMVGTYCGVMALASLGAFYAGAVFTGLIGLKSGVYSPAIMVSALAAALAFSAVYGVMLLSASYVRSAAVAALAGGALFVAATTLTLPELAASFDPGWPRTTYVIFTAPLPRLWLLGHLGPWAAGYEELAPATWRVVSAALVFGFACVALSIRRIEGRDF